MKIRNAALVLTLMFAATLAWADEEGAEPAQKETETPTAQPAQPAQQQPAAAADATVKKAGANRPGVLDFEAELIEGERKSPDMFLQLQSGTPNLDAILFQRTNFNDFHNLEKHRRPLYRRYVK
jgi:uncharacterized iron-regulated membrane protein